MTQTYKPTHMDGPLVDRRRVARLRAIAFGNVEKDFLEIEPYIDRLAKADLKDVQGVAASQLQLMNGYCKIVLSYARRNFFWALVGAGIGIGFFVAAAAYSMLTGKAVAAIPLLISGSVIEAIAGLGFYLNSHTAAQLSDFQLKLEALQRHVLANSICESLSGDKKEQVRAELVRRIANIHHPSFLTSPPQQSSQP